MPVQIPWQYLLPYDVSDEPDAGSPAAHSQSEADNSAIMSIANPHDHARQIALALAAGASRADIQRLTLSVLDGLLHRD